MQTRQRASTKRHSSQFSTDVQVLRREVRKERTAREEAQRRQESLQWQVDSLTKENEQFRKGRSQTEELLRKEIRTLQLQVKKLTASLERARKKIAWFDKQYFGNKSEKDDIKPIEDSDSEADDVQVDVPPVGEKRRRGQQPGSAGHGRSDRSGLPEEPVPLEIPGCACPKCFKPYLVLPETDDSRLTAIDVFLFQYLYQRRRYVAQCKCLGKKLVTAPPPPRLYPRTTIDNTLWVYLATQKFLNGEPLNRTLKSLSLQGLSLSAGTVVGGFKLIDCLLDQLYAEVVKRCQGANFWNADETSWRVFEDDNGERGKRQWWFWLVASVDAVVYILDRSRSKEVPKEFFAGSSGVLMTDRLASYKGLCEAIKKAWCWVHQRRDFLKIYSGMPKLKKWAQEWLLMITELFVLNHKRLELWQENKPLGKGWESAQQALERHAKKMEERCEKELAQGGLHEQQRKALRSMQKHWTGLTLFLLDARIPMDNNRAERLLRGLVVNRKNSYGSGVEWSGRTAAKFHTILQTWLLNGLNPQALLLDFLNECSKTPGTPPVDVNRFLPWRMSDQRKQHFALPSSYKKPG